jgi:hypothetical protein
MQGVQIMAEEKKEVTDEAQESTEPEFDKDAILARLDEAEKAKKLIQRRYEEEQKARAELLKRVETEEQRAERERREREEELSGKERQLKNYETQLIKAGVMIDEKIPSRFEKFLIGKTREDFVACWKALKESIDAEAKKIRTENAGKAVPVAGGQVQTDFSKMSIDEAMGFIKKNPDKKGLVMQGITKK